MPVNTRKRRLGLFKFPSRLILPKMTSIKSKLRCIVTETDIILGSDWLSTNTI